MNKTKWEGRHDKGGIPDSGRKGKRVRTRVTLGYVCGGVGVGSGWGGGGYSGSNSKHWSTASFLQLLPYLVTP